MVFSHLIKAHGFRSDAHNGDGMHSPYEGFGGFWGGKYGGGGSP